MTVRRFTRGARRAISRIHRAKKELAAARALLARETKRGDPDVAVPSGWTWVHRALEAHGGRLLRYPGVLGCGLGFRHRGGVPTDEPCITVFVRRKLAKAALGRRKLKALPRFIRFEGRRVAVDVMSLGRIELHLGAGQSTGPAIKPSLGTIGALANDEESAGTVAITAMHVSGLEDYPWSGAPQVPFTVPSRLGAPAAPIVGSLARGTMRGVDAAKIRLIESVSPVTELPGIGKIAGWRPAVYPDDFGAPVRMYGAVSGLQPGFIVHPFTHIPGAGLDAAITATIQSANGDSGAALVDAHRFLLGFLVGEATGSLGGLRLFCPVSLVLDRLSCRIE